MTRNRLIAVFLLIILLFLSFPRVPLRAEEDLGFTLPSLQIGLDGGETEGDLSLAMQLIFLITILSLAPGIMLMVTSFTRIIIVLTFVGRALSLQGMPPRQVLVSLAIFLTFFIMAPTVAEINQRSVQPYLAGELGQLPALQEAAVPLRAFLLRNTRQHDLAFFIRTADLPRPETRADVPIWVLIPAFMLSELTRGFVMGVLIFIPFVVIDMVTASVLMSMGMMMLPPVMISLPFKIMLFVLVDGWSVIADSIVQTYGM